MAEEQTMWSKTLLDGFIDGMKKKPSDGWIKDQANELAQRGMSVDYLSKILRKDVGDVAADRFLNVMGGSPTAARAKPKKKAGLLGKLFGK
ncbi:MAG: hypothetical protein OQL16_13335 [Gammaproteobacteria bacterium]|nr:hypothetical protein [Gammaproteobacteria bacterium]